MTSPRPTPAASIAELTRLRSQLEDLLAAFTAIRGGGVDAIMVGDPERRVVVHPDQRRPSLPGHRGGDGRGSRDGVRTRRAALRQPPAVRPDRPRPARPALGAGGRGWARGGYRKGRSSTGDRDLDDHRHWGLVLVPGRVAGCCSRGAAGGVLRAGASSMLAIHSAAQPRQGGQGGHHLPTPQPTLGARAGPVRGGLEWTGPGRCDRPPSRPGPTTSLRR
jgi:hypothetical protein